MRVAFPGPGGDTMPVYDRPMPGYFCWVDLQAEDTDVARRFYNALFDWRLEDMPMGQQKYTIE
jgi:predicted enzyme related to lactoylglutathione lyase